MAKLRNEFIRTNEKLQDRLTALVDPLSVHFGITTFWHFVQYADGRCTSVSTQHESWAFYWEQGYYRQIDHLVAPTNMRAGSYLLEFEERYKDFQDQVEQSAPIHHPFIIVRKSGADRGDIFGFASSRYNPRLPSTYLNHLGILNKCIDYHLETNSGEISKAEEFAPNMAELRGERAFYGTAYDGGVVQDPARNLQILGEYGIEAELLSAAMRLSRREKQVIDASAQGLTAAQMGKKWRLSPRTVEYYLECAKVKLGIYSRPELIRVGHLLKAAGLVVSN